MLAKYLALEQALRFEHYAGFPGEAERPADWQELVVAFQEAGRDAEHVREIGDWLIRNRAMPECRFCPVPAEVFGAASATRPFERVPNEEWRPEHKPDDEPFGGLMDLVDDRLLELLRRRSQSARTHTERESAKRLIASAEVRQKRLTAPAAEPLPELLDSLDERMLADLRDRSQRGGTQAQRDDAKRLLDAWEARQSQAQTVGAGDAR